MSPPYGSKPPKKSFISGGIESIPAGAHMIPIEIKNQYDTVPLQLYHPSPHEAITILRNKKNQNEWLVCGWYIDTYRQGGVVKGLLYKQVTLDADKEYVIAELKKRDKEGSAKFAL